MTAPLRAQILLAAAVGGVVGILGAVGWRHATRPVILIDNPPPTAPGSRGFLFTGDLQYISGPRWWPEMLVLPAIGAVVAMVLSLICWTVLRARTGRVVESLLVSIPAAVTGASVGGVAVLFAHVDRPRVLSRIVEEAPRDPSGADDLVAGGPWSHELAPIGVWFPVVGILAALLVSAALSAGRWALRRSAIQRRH